MCIRDRLNSNGETHVAWCWKAGGNSNTFNVDGVGYATQAAAGIHAGNLSLTGASVNTKAGFSILTWTGDGNASANVGTGFSSDKPLSWAIVKKTSTSSDWQVGHRGSGNLSNFAYHYNLNDASDVDKYTVHNAFMKGLAILLDNLGNSLVRSTFRLFPNGAFCTLRNSSRCGNITNRCLR